jgi:predicted small integral membrane protein
MLLGGLLVLQALGAAALVAAVPAKDEGRDWFAPLIKGGWMAWTFPSAVFFLVILALITLMAFWESLSPGGSPRVGILRFETTRGDRLFLSLLGAAFIQLGWLAFVGSNLWWALGLSVIYAVFVFRTV